MPALPSILLIADDEPVISTLVARVAMQAGFTPLIVHNGADAITAAQTYVGALVGAILDVRMPGLTGVDVAEAIHQPLPALPLVLMTASVPPHLLSRIAQLPLVALLPKPFPLATLRTILTQLRLPGQTPEADAPPKEGEQNPTPIPASQ
jgi:CheY-like chemotaxis protein